MSTENIKERVTFYVAVLQVYCLSDELFRHQLKNFLRRQFFRRAILKQPDTVKFSLNA